MSSKRITLAEQIAQLDEPAPVDYDPEAIDATAVDPEDPAQDVNGGDVAAGREHYVDVGPSSIRKLHDSVSDPKYDGVRIMRNQLMEDDDDDVQSDDLEEEQREEGSTGHQHDGGEGDIDSPEEDFSSQSESGRVPTPRPASQLNARSPSPPLDDLSSTLKKTREDEREKGKAVSRQLAIYDSLLDARIRLQKCASSTNKLPDPSIIPSYLLSAEARRSADAMLKEAMYLSDELSDLRENFMTTIEISPPPRKRRRVESLEDDEDRDWEEEIQEHSAHAALLESTFHPYLLTTLQKWSNKILAVAPSALLPSNRTKFSRSANSQLKSATQLIEETLADREKLLTRTRTWRGKGERIGVATARHERHEHEDQERDGREDLEGHVDVFDDTDFYQQLLRDVINSRSGIDAGLGPDEDWRGSQKQKKPKKTVDTKASKGRKLRYEVHEKLQNFMVPVPVHGAWHDEQIDELFASLLGKGFVGLPTSQAVDVPAGHDAAMELDTGAQGRLQNEITQALKGGFRVFG